MKIELTQKERDRAIAMDRLMNSNPSEQSADSAIRHMEAFKRLVTSRPQEKRQPGRDERGLYSWQTSPWD